MHSPCTVCMYECMYQCAVPIYCVLCVSCCTAVYLQRVAWFCRVWRLPECGQQPICLIRVAPGFSETPRLRSSIRFASDSYYYCSTYDKPPKPDLEKYKMCRPSRYYKPSRGWPRPLKGQIVPGGFWRVVELPRV